MTCFWGFCKNVPSITSESSQSVVGCAHHTRAAPTGRPPRMSNVDFRHGHPDACASIRVSVAEFVSCPRSQQLEAFGVVVKTS